jgi:hypothetical protein
MRPRSRDMIFLTIHSMRLPKENEEKTYSHEGLSSKLNIICSLYIILWAVNGVEKRGFLHISQRQDTIKYTTTIDPRKRQYRR